ncbi:MAG: pirin family protein [Pseudomonadota bacterium]
MKRFKDDVKEVPVGQECGMSFANYHDPSRVNWGSLRVWNDDTIAPGTGFPTHPHNDMEIITYVRKGAITHRDSMGNEGRTEAGDVQVMSAGTGVQHSEYNREDEDTQIFQIWIIPDERGGEPSWGARAFPKDDRAGQFVPLATSTANDNDQAEGALPIRTDARVLGATIKAGESLTYTPSAADRHLYLVPATGKVRVEEVEAKARDGVAITQLEQVTITALEDSEVVLVDAA